MAASKCTSATTVVRQLRELMKSPEMCREAAPLHAYIVPWNDAHNSEYLAPCDQRRAFLSGFTGSAGTAVVTQEEARLWTDGRYYLQASQQLDPSCWQLMKESVPGTPSQGAWLCKVLPPGSRVGADPWLVRNSVWRSLQEQLTAAGHSLVAVARNLVDALWSGRPERPCDPVRVWPARHAGKTSAEKVRELRAAMAEGGAAVFVVTALDEVAWLLNLRGSDIQYNPVFFAFVAVTQDALHLFVEDAKLGPEVRDYLRDVGYPVHVRPYEEVREALAGDLLVGSDGKRLRAWLDSHACRALVVAAGGGDVLTIKTGDVSAPAPKLEVSPVALAKAIKNETEVAGMKAAHVRDGAALCRYLAWLEGEVAAGRRVTEVSGAAQLLRFRSEEALFVGASFETISSVGEHGAIVHHSPSPETELEIDVRHVYLCDSGGQYLDGTTDVTRTVHFGEPTEHERECFTRVLRGQLALSTAVFPDKVRGNHLDGFARRPLWEVGLNYQHGTGHGIGAHLCVHEGPMGISWRAYPDDPGLQAGMFLSNEPGYYEDGHFGIRIENIELVVKARFDKTIPKPDGSSLSSPPAPMEFLTFETVTLAPVQKKMIVVSMLSEAERRALDSYHERCRRLVGEHLRKSGHVQVAEWLDRATQPI